MYLSGAIKGDGGHPGQRLSAKLMPLDSLEERDLGRRRELAEVALEPNPFFEPDYLQPLAEGLEAPPTSASSGRA